MRIHVSGEKKTLEKSFRVIWVKLNTLAFVSDVPILSQLFFSLQALLLVRGWRGFLFDELIFRTSIEETSKQRSEFVWRQMSVSSFKGGIHLRNGRN